MGILSWQHVLVSSLRLSGFQSSWLALRPGRPAQCQNSEKNVMEALWVSVQDLLRQLPRLLGQKGVSDVACTRAAACVKLVVQCVAAFKPLMLKELEAELHGCDHGHSLLLKFWVTPVYACHPVFLPGVTHLVAFPSCKAYGNSTAMVPAFMVAWPCLYVCHYYQVRAPAGRLGCIPHSHRELWRGGPNSAHSAVGAAG